MHPPNLTVTAHDARRLDALLQSPIGRTSSVAALLEEELVRANVVDDEQLPAGVVTMHSRVVCEDTASGERHELELVYPHEADAQHGRVSVLAPIGAALLGLSAGDAIDWPLPGGRTAHMRVIAVPFQPEATRRIG